MKSSSTINKKISLPIAKKGDHVLFFINFKVGMYGFVIKSSSDNSCIYAATEYFHEKMPNYSVLSSLVYDKNGTLKSEFQLPNDLIPNSSLAKGAFSVSSDGGDGGEEEVNLFTFKNCELIREGKGGKCLQYIL